MSDRPDRLPDFRPFRWRKAVGGTVQAPLDGKETWAMWSYHGLDYDGDPMRDEGPVLAESTHWHVLAPDDADPTLLWTAVTLCAQGFPRFDGWVPTIEVATNGLRPGPSGAHCRRCIAELERQAGP